MQDLRVIGVENGALLVASNDGERFRIPIDEVLQSKLRQTVPAPGSDKKISPREIQAHIRGGMSAQEVSEHTGVALEYIEKFEGPVMAEREFVVESAMGVPVHTALETDPTGGATFGEVIGQRLEGLNARDIRWASWKEETAGWIIKLSFTAGQIDHDARWQFDAKKLSLSPLNSEAVTLSQQGEATGVLIPRLRAVTDRPTDTSRFDSGAFLVDEAEPARNFATRVAEVEAAAEADGYQKNQTADLLEALRRRRGERETASYADEEAPVQVTAEHPSAGGIRLVTVPLDDYFDETPTEEPAAEPENSGPIKPLRKGRAAMPSWDDIVFGARNDDDLA